MLAKFPHLLGARPKNSAIRVSPLLMESARLERQDVFTKLASRSEGLTAPEAEERLAQHGPNVVAGEKEHTWLWRMFTAVRNPLVILLLVLSTISYATGDIPGGTVMMLMVMLGVSLRFVQE